MYLLIENFNSGMDSRKMALTAKPGTLQELTNCHITRGGEIEKRKAFVPIATLPTGQTFGLHGANGQLWTFGSASNPTITQPAGPGTSDPLNDVIPRISYMRLNAGGTQVSAVLPPHLIPRTTTTRARKHLLVTMAGHLMVDGEKYLMTIAGYRIYWTITYVSATQFTVSTDLTGAVTNCVCPGGTLNSSATSSVSDTGKTIRVSWWGTSFGGLSSATTNYKLYFPEDSSLNGNYKITSWDNGVLSSGGYFYFYNEFDLPSYTGTITKCIVAPAITNLKVNVSDADVGTGGTNLITTEVPWVFDAGLTESGSATLTAAALAVEINKGTGTHGATASASDGVITIIGAGNVGGKLWGMIRNGQVITQGGGSNTNDRGVFGYFRASGTNMTKLIKAENYNGKIYAIAEFDSTNIIHFYNGVRVTDWDSIALSGDNNAVATAFAKKIKLEGYYSAINSNNVIYINFYEEGVDWTVTTSTVNGGNTNDQTLTVNTTAATPTSPQVTTVTIGGTYEPADVLTITINSVAYSVQSGASSVGTYLKTHQGKMYSVANSLLYFSETDTNGGADSFTLTNSKGSGFINMTNQDAGSETLTSLEIYQGKLAIFSGSSVQIWAMNADPNQNAISQIINNVGTYAPRSVVSLGSIDTFFLSSSGVRSLKSRDVTNSAVVADVGTAIDSIIASDIRSVNRTVREAAIGIIEPAEGRYWLSVGPKIYVYSYFPTQNISAWSIYTPLDMTQSPGSQTISPDDMTTLSQRVYVRDGDKVYAYGGYDGNTYDTSPATVTFPYLDAGKPSHIKTLTGVDAACDGDWEVYVGMDPSQPTDRLYQGLLEGSSYGLTRFQASGVGTHVGVQLTHALAEYARIGNFAIQFELNNA